MRVLLTGVGGPAGRSLAAQLRAGGHWVGGTDVRDVTIEVDAFLRVCAVPDPSYLSVLAELARRWAVDAVIPSVSEELVRLAGSRAALPVPVLIGSLDAVTTANDKLLTARALAVGGVAGPRSAVPSAFASAEHATVTMGGPIVVKPRVSRGGRGVRVVFPDRARLPETAMFWATLDDTTIVQEFAPGTEYAPVVFHDEDGSCRVATVLEKTKLKQGNVGNALSVIRADGPGTDDVRTLACAAAATIGLSGPADIDVRRRSDGTPVVLEVNARFGAHSASAPEMLDAALRALRRQRSLVSS